MSPGLFEVPEVEDRKRLKPTAENRYAATSIPEVSYWSDSSSDDTEPTCSVDTTLGEGIESGLDDTLDSYSDSSIETLLEISQAMPPYLGSKAQMSAWKRVEVNLTNFSLSKPRDLLRNAGKDLELCMLGTNGRGFMFETITGARAATRDITSQSVVGIKVDGSCCRTEKRIRMRRRGNVQKEMQLSTP